MPQTGAKRSSKSANLLILIIKALITQFITHELAPLSSDKRPETQDFSHNFIKYVDFTGCIYRHFGN